MRCRRCHSKIDPTKKMCPVCGTLIRKPRGAVKLAPEAGGNKVLSAAIDVKRKMSSINPKIVLAVVCGILLIVVMALTFNCADCGEQDNSGFSSCSGCSSCSSCSSCGSCNSCGSCSSCDSSESNDSKPETVKPRKSTSSCSGNAVVYDKLENSVANGREFVKDGVLYYADSTGIHAMNVKGELTLVTPGSSINSIYVNSTHVYYLMAGNLWRSPIEKPIVVDGDDKARYASEKLLDATASGSDIGVDRIHGFSVDGNKIVYWGSTPSDSFSICTRDVTTGAGDVIYSGKVAQVQYYRSRVFFLSRNDEDFNTAYSVDISTKERIQLFDGAVTYFALCDGSLFAYTWTDDAKDGVPAHLYKIDVDTLSVLGSWQFVSIRGMMGNDSYVYYYRNNADGTSNVCLLSPDVKENKEIFFNQGAIQLNHIAGSYFSVYTGVDETAENRLAGASYYIINTGSGEKILIF